MPPALKAVFAQLAGWIAAIAMARAGLLPSGIWPIACVQVVTAMAAAGALRSARWWLPIHLGFAPLLIIAGRLGIAPGWYLGAFAALVAVYWTSFRTQVPLYLSNRETLDAVAALLPVERPLRVLDLGSGTGSLLLPLARQQPDVDFRGIEAAPAPWLVSWLRARGRRNIVFERGDFFAFPWSDFNVIYAFLSPVPMTNVWQKAQRELKKGSMLISNSFPVSGRKPDSTIEVPDRRATKLYVYRLGGERSPAK